jgi:hypothetical protein
MNKSKLSGFNIRIVLSTLMLTLISGTLCLNLNAQNISFEVMAAMTVQNARELQLLYLHPKMKVPG